MPFHNTTSSTPPPTWIMLCSGEILTVCQMMFYISYLQSSLLLHAQLDWTEVGIWKVCSSTVALKPVQAFSTAAISEQYKSESPHYQLFKIPSDLDFLKQFTIMVKDSTLLLFRKFEECRLQEVESLVLSKSLHMALDTNLRITISKNKNGTVVQCLWISGYISWNLSGPAWRGAGHLQTPQWSQQNWVLRILAPGILEDRSKS